MQNNQPISVRHKNGNLHIDLIGNFTGNTAETLTTAMVESYQGKGNIFIKTSKITDISSDSRDIFSQLLTCSGLPKKKVYLMGERGKDIGADGTRVLAPPKKKHGPHGCGNCKNCTCDKENIM